MAWPVSKGIARWVRGPDGSGRVPRWLLLLAAFTVPAWILRAANLVDRHVMPRALDVRGAIADVVVAAMWAAVVATVARYARPRVASAVAAVDLLLYTAVSYANFEHVLALDVPLDLERSDHAASGTFLQGSVLAISRPILLVVLMGSSIFFAKKAIASTAGWRVWPYVGVLSSGAVILWIWSLPRFARAWRGTNFLLLLASAPWTTAADRQGVDASIGARVDAAFAADLDGEPQVELGQWRNVLVVMIEGASGCYLPRVAALHGIRTDRTMPRLDALAAERGVTFTSFVAHQRQTHRGEYAVLCGDYPELTPTTSKATELAEAVTRTCLPAMLRDTGYHTVYLQPANLNFMMKNRFMPNAGFEELHGHEHFSEGHAVNGWGIDDLAFYEQSVEILARLQTEGRPWFGALLTVGTHHPYLAPEGYAPDEGDAFVRALHYADEAVVWLLEELQRRGILDDTLVLVTSDEAAGWTDPDRSTSDVASQNCGLLVAFGKGLKPSRIDALYGQVDLGLSVLDAMGLALDGRGLVGRSIFRRYEGDRLMFAASAGRVYAWDGPRRLLTCSQALDDCTTLVGATAFAQERAAIADASAGLLLAEALERAAPTARRGAASSHVYALVTPGQSFTVPDDARRLVYGGQYLEIPAGREAAVELELRVEGTRGRVTVEPDLALRYAIEHVFRIPPLRPGDVLRMRYRISGRQALQALETRLYARRSADADARLVFERATLAVGPRVGRPGIHLDHALVESQPEGTFDLRRGLVTHRCVDAQARPARGVACDGGALVYGPYTSAPAGARVVATFSVRGSHGEVAVDIVAERGKTRLRRCEAVPLTADERVEVTCAIDLDARVRDVEGRLHLIADAPVDVEIEHAAVTVVGERVVTEVLPPGRVRPRRK